MSANESNNLPPIPPPKDWGDCPVLPTRVLPAQDGIFFTVSFSEDGQYCARSNWTKRRVTVWETTTGSVVQDFTRQVGLPAVFSRSVFVASADEDSLSICNITNETIKTVWHGEGWSYENTKLCFTQDGSIIVGITPAKISCWDVSNLSLTAMHSFPKPLAIIGVRPLPDGRVAVFCYGVENENSTQELSFWTMDAVSGQRLSVLPVSKVPAHFVPSHDGMCVVVTDSRQMDQNVEVWNPVLPYCVCTCDILPVLQPEGMFGQANRLLACRYRRAWDQPVSIANSVSVFDIPTGKLQFTFANEHYLPSFMIDANRDRLAIIINSQAWGHRTTFWNARRGKVLGATGFHPTDTNTPVFSPCGRWFASVSTHNSAFVQANTSLAGEVYLTDLRRLSQQE